MEVTTFGSVTGGALHLNSRSAFIKDLQCFNDMEVVVTVEKRKKKRSSPQNRYYHGCVIPSLRHAMEAKGCLIQSNEIVHLLCKFKFLKGEIVNTATGEVIPTIGSTTKLSTLDFENYLEQIRAYAASEYDCVIALPNEQTEIFNN